MNVSFAIPNILANPVPVPMTVFKVFYLGVLPEPLKRFLHKDLALMSEIVTSSGFAHVCNFCFFLQSTTFFLGGANELIIVCFAFNFVQVAISLL